MAEADDLSKHMLNLDISSEEEKDDDYFMHIDILKNDKEEKHTAPLRINSFMIEHDAYDPRRATNFPTDLMDREDKKNPTLKLRRKLGGDLGREYYELWKVRRDFPLEELIKMIKGFKKTVKVQLLLMDGSDHVKYTFEGEKEEFAKK